MKKKLNGRYSPRVGISKILLKMKLITIFLLVAFAATSANSYSQSTKFNLRLNDVTVKDVFQQIEENSEFILLYNEKSVDLNRKVNVRVKDETIESVLEQVFKGTGNNWKIYDRQIVVLAANETETSAGILVQIENLEQQPQRKEITGSIKDARGMPLPGVTVVVKGTTTGTVSGNDGNFSLQVPLDANTLIFSFVGMKSQEINLAGRTSVNIVMEEETLGIEEVVAVGYGTMKKVNLTGSVAFINFEKLENRPITNSSQALQGVSGVYVNQAGGQPGRDGASIRIRGQGTLNNNNPLIIVDGIEQSLSDVNPNDIESISVLKDAASASIYGSRAASGVILITTKRGVEGDFKVEYGNYFGVQSPTYLPKLINDPVEYMELRNQAQRNAGRTKVDFSDDIIEEYRQGRLTDPYTYPENDWVDIMFNNAFIQEHNLRISGGKEGLTSSLSIGYTDQEGILMNTNSNKLSLRSNINYQITDNIKIGSEIAIMHRFIHQSAASIDGGESLMQNIWKMKGYDATYLEDGRYADTWVVTPGHNINRHPLVWANEGFNDTKILSGLISLYTNIKLPLGFLYHAKISGNKSDGFTSVFVPEIYMYDNKSFRPIKVTYNTNPPNRHVRNRDDEDLNITMFHTLSWEGTFKESHNIIGLIGSSYEKFTSRFFDGKIEGFLGNELHVINAGSINPSTNGNFNENYLIGVFGRFNYNYKQKYLFESNLRYDGSSRFAKGSRWGLFPSLSAGWRLSEEAFLDNINWLSNLTMRVSHGSLGNERIGNFQYVNVFNQQQPYLFDGNVAQGAAITGYKDPTITWETTTISNLGLDIFLFRNKLDFSVELYNKKTKDILRPVNLPSQVGDLSGPTMNIGTVSNKGIEWNLIHRNNIRDFTYTIGAGVNYNVNKVEDLNGQVIYSGMYIIKEGYPIDSYYIYESDGIFQTQEEIDNSPFQNISTKPGYLKYKDQNGDNVINQEDRVIIGGAIPKYTYSMNFDFSFKNWSLSGLFNGVQGIETYPRGSMAIPFWFGSSVTEEWRDNSWTPDNRDARLPIMVPWELARNDVFELSDFWLKDASYLRLKNLQFSYSFPKQKIEKIGLENLVLFMNGQNILTISKMKDFDPERNIKLANYFEYPSVKIYSIGLNVTF